MESTFKLTLVFPTWAYYLMSDFIISTKQWDVQQLKGLVNEEDLNTITKIPISGFE